MNGVAAAPPQRFKCAHGDCGATFTKQRKLEEHETVHTGEVRMELYHLRICLFLNT